MTFHDISYAQGLYDMDSDPNPVIFMKMSGFYYGSKTGYFDTQASRNYNAAVRLNKVPGMYHFAGGGDPNVEADFFVSACSPLAENDVLILDYELTDEMNPPSDPNAWCLAFVERVHQRTGVWPLFYTYSSMLQRYGFAGVLRNCGLWIANYGVSPNDTIANIPPYIAHQWQGSPLDTSELFVSLETLKKYGYHIAAPQPPAPMQPEPTPIPDPVVVPVPSPEPTPPVPVVVPPVVVTPDLSVENNNMLKQILGMVSSLYNYFKGQFKSFKKYK